jgi:ribosome-associated protein
MDIRKLQRVIVDGLEDVKAQNILVFNTEHLSALFERVIIASGTSNRQTKSLASSVREAVKGAGYPHPRTEGESNGEWIIIDCGAAVVHVMQPTIREYYHLEEIWGDKPVNIKLASAETRLVKAAEPDAKPARATAKKAAAKKATGKTAAVKKTAKKAPARPPLPISSTRLAAAKKAAPAATAPRKAPAKKTPASSARVVTRVVGVKKAVPSRSAAKKVPTRAPVRAAAKTATKAPAKKATRKA